MTDATHFDLFSGIGGFAIAAQAAGFSTVAFCESDKRCRAFLEKRWGLPVEPDIRKLDGRRYAGVSLITGGPPCQPASRAGKQGGEADDRWLWPEALRVLEEALPLAVVFENPLGIGDVAEYGIFPPMGGYGSAIGDIGDTFNRSGPGVFDKILGDIESLGYEAQPFDIPACSVDSPQLRHRYWVVGFLVDSECSERRANAETRGCNQPGQHGRREAAGGTGERDQAHLADAAGGGFGTDGSAPRSSGHADERDESRNLGESDENGYVAGKQTASTSGHGNTAESAINNVANAAESGRERRDTERGSDGCSSERAQSLVADPERERRDIGREQSKSQPARDGWTGSTGEFERHWQNAIWVPCADGKLRRAPDDSFVLVNGLHRSLLGALGNAIVPALAYQILRAVRQTLA